LFELDPPGRKEPTGKQCDGWLLSGIAFGYVPRAAEVPDILSVTRCGNEPRAAEVPFFTLLDPLSITSAARHGQTM
jgi:hypothetical protein